MKVLILENSSHRIKKLKQKYAHEELVTICYSALDACEQVLKKGFRYDLILIDYDLGSRNTGNLFASQLCDINPIMFSMPKIVLHTWNPMGALIMSINLKIHGIKSKWIPCQWPI